MSAAFTLLALCAFGAYCQGASIGDSLSVHEVDPVREAIPYEGHPETTNIAVMESQQILESQPLLETESIVVPEEVVPDGQRAIQEDVINAGVPYGHDAHDENFPLDVVPVAAAEENCDEAHDIIDQVSADRAEREADKDLLKALDSVLANRETLEDVIQSENLALA